MIKKITIENYRSCLSTSFECDPHLSVLIGPNSSGKTNILQAIMLLQKMAQEEDRSRFEHSRITVSSRIRAAFSTTKVKTQLTATVSVFTDESNRDKVTASRQKWTIIRPNNERASFELPFFAASMFSGKPVSSPYFFPSRYHRHRYIHVSRYRQFMVGEPDFAPKWTFNALAEAWRFCDGLRYYGASQFTSPGDCPVSFEIEKEGDPKAFLAALVWKEYRKEYLNTQHNEAIAKHVMVSRLKRAASFALYPPFVAKIRRRF